MSAGISLMFIKAGIKSSYKHAKSLKFGQKFHIAFFLEIAYNKSVPQGIQNVNSGASPPLRATCIFTVLRYCKCDLYILGASPP